MINITLEKILQEIIEQPFTRKDNFYNIGQNYFKPIEGKDLIDLVDSIWNYFCTHAEKWKGQLLLPQFYRYYQDKNHPKDIWYTVKEYFMWAVFYPEELKEHFIMKDNGNIDIIGDTTIRVINKEIKKESFIDSSGKKTMREIKPSIDFIIPSGFSIAQKDDIISTCIAGIMTHSPRYTNNLIPPLKVKKVVKKTKKSIEIDNSNDEKISIEDNLNNINAISKKNTKQTKKTKSIINTEKIIPKKKITTKEAIEKTKKSIKKD